MEINLTAILEQTDRIPTSGDAACTVAGMSNSFYTQVKLHDKSVNLQKTIFLHLLIGVGGGGAGLINRRSCKTYKNTIRSSMSVLLTPSHSPKRSSQPDSSL